MSVFKVNLDQGLGRAADGYLDPSKVAGYSIQRTIYLPGPNKITRKLNDGDTFTDVNYWKRFTVAGGQDPSIASLVVLVDDGSVWSDYVAENTFPYSYHLTVGSSSAYASNVVNIVGDNGSPALFTQITVGGSGTAPTFRFNGNASATMSILHGTTQVFDKGDLLINKIEIDNTQSGNASATVDIFLSIRAIPNS